MNTCKWCGKTYRKKHNRQVYCSPHCSQQGRRYLKTIWQRTYRKKYGIPLTVGTGGLGKTPRPTHEEELQTVEKELRKHGLKPL